MEAPLCQFIELEGPPRERGLAYGRAAGERIAKGIGHYGAQLAKSGLDEARFAKLVARFLPRVEAFDATYVTEMRAIAEGAGQPFEAIMLLNARTEILKLAQRPDDAPDGCTGVVALPIATADGQVIHAQNWDWKADCVETAVVLRIHRDDGPDILTFSEAGQLARCGMNAAGIALTANYLQCERDYRDIGVPLALIRRKILEQERFALALHAAYTTPKSAANNLMLSHANGLGFNFECAPDETFPVANGDGLLVHANHWQSPVALSKLRDTGVLTTPDSLYRDLRVRDLLRDHIPRISVDRVKLALFDDLETPWSVCRPPRLNLGGVQVATVAMIVMEPGAGRMQVAMLPALNQSFQCFMLDMAIQRPTRTRLP
jgi:isopenicillin-N N-acyltransferase-like protein